eukprot:g50849.t1
MPAAVSRYQLVPTEDDVELGRGQIQGEPVHHVPEIVEGVDISPGAATQPGQQSSTSYELFFIAMGSQAKKAVPCGPTWTLEQLRNHAFPEELKEGKYIRIIYMGSQLDDDASTLEALGLESGGMLHYVVSDTKPPTEEERRMQMEADERAQEEAENILVWRHDPHTPIHPSIEGSNSDFVFGFMLGFFLGYLAFIWLWQRGIPRKRRLGILTGVAARFLMMLNSNPQTAHGNTRGGIGDPSDPLDPPTGEGLIPTGQPT